MDSKSPTPPKLPAEEVLHAYSPRPAVRRLSGKAVMILIGAAALVFVVRIGINSHDRGASSTGDRELGSRFRATDDILERGPIGRLPDNYSFLPPRPIKGSEPVPPQAQRAEEKPDPDMLRRIEQLRRELETALDSPIAFSGFQSQTLDTSSARFTPSPYSSVSAPGATDDASVLMGDAQRRQFFSQAAEVPSYVSARLESPRSPYEIKAGTIIPAVLVTAINSDLPGDVIGQVAANVYNSVTGRHLLVPQGSRLIGRYNSDVLNGHNRVLIAWQRLILPNGNSIVLEAMPGTDAAGVAGMDDRVDYHIDRLAAATLLSTLIALGGNLSVQDTGHSMQLDIVGSTVAQQASRLAQRFIDRELDVKPTILIRAGMPFNVLVNRDLILAPYEPVRDHR